MKTRPNDYTMFRKSKPWGYNPPDVESKIDEYEKALRETNQALTEERRKNSLKDQEIMRLQEELRSMHIQMSSLELPDADDYVERMVLEEFKEYNNTHNEGSKKEPKQKKKNLKINKKTNGYKDNGDDFVIVS